MRSFTAKHLHPGSRMGEVLFGLIMTLTFTLGAGLVFTSPGACRERSHEVRVRVA